MPGQQASGSKRKAQGDASREAAAAGSGDLVYMIQCTRDSGVDEYDDDFCTDCHGDEQEQAECLVKEAIKELDGTWMYNAPVPGSKKQKPSSSGSSSGIVVFKTLEAANARAAQVWKYLQADPPFDSEADPVEGEEGDTSAEQGPDAFKTDSRWARKVGAAAVVLL
jgi:hypothetical protein